MKRIILAFYLIGLSFFYGTTLLGQQTQPTFIDALCKQLSLCSGSCDDPLFQNMPKEEWLKLCADIVVQRQSEFERTNVMLDSVECIVKSVHRCNLNMYSNDLTVGACLADVSLADSNAVVFVSMLCNALVKDEVTVPFYVDYFLSKIIPDMERFMPHSELLALNYANLILANAELSEMNVASAEEIIVQTLPKLKAFESRFESFSCAVLQQKMLMAYSCACSPTLVIHDATDKDALVSIWHDVQAFYAKVESYFQTTAYASQFESLRRKLQFFPEAYLLQYILPCDPTYHDEFTDKSALDGIALCESLLESGHSSQTFKFALFHVYKLFQVYMGQISYVDASNALDAYYNAVTMETIMAQGLLQSYANVISVQIFLCDMSELSLKEKRKRINLYCDRLTQAFHCSLQVKVSRLHRGMLAYKFLTYWRIYKYLSADERTRFFNAIKVYTNVQYFIHSEMVSRICTVLLDAIFDYQPNLLVGTQNLQSVDEVLKSKTRKSMTQFLKEGVENYDIGKACMPTVTSSYFHLFVPRQKEMVELHPVFGSQVLKATPHLQSFEDFVLNHHKWYNGKRGYPSWVDNTLSDVRLLVDILTVADCLEASVINPYRLAYTKGSTFDEYLDLMHRMSFTRFNPNIVSLIRNHPDVKQRINELLEFERGEVYYQVYQRYLMHHKEK